MRVAAALVIVVLGSLGRVAAAQPALDKPPFTATPAELLAVAKATPRGAGGDVVGLREEHEMSYDEQGRLTNRVRFVFAVLTQRGADDWDQLGSSWQPAFQDKPQLRARVIDAQGHVVELDQKGLTDSPSVTNGAPDDRRRLSAQLPRLQVGAIVEQEVVIVDRVPMIGGGRGIGTGIGDGSSATASTRITFSAPTKLKLRVFPRGLPRATRPAQEIKNGRQTWVFTFGPVEQLSEYESFLPGDVRLPHVEATPVQSWGVIAGAMRTLVDKQIAAGPIALPADIATAATLDTVRAVLAWVRRQVRPNDISFDDTALVPSTPAETLKRGVGDAKDIGTVIVAALRQAKIRAELVALSVGPGVDVDPDIPSFNGFDHVVVRAHLGASDVWIDPIEELAAVGRLPAHVQGRRGLPISDDTKALVTIPAAASTDNVIREVRTFDIPEAELGNVTEVSTEGGVFEAAQRTWIRDSSPEDVKKNLTTYASNEFASAKLDRYSTSAVDDLQKPFEMTLVASKSQRAHTDRRQIDVYLFATDALDRLPDELSQAKADAPMRKFDLQLARPHVHEIENRLVIPAGYTLPTPVAETERALGTMKLVRRERLDGRTFVVTFRFDTGKARLTPAEVRDVQTAVRAIYAEPAVHLVVDHTALALAKSGKLKDAIAEAKKLIQLHPKEALHHDQLALVYLEVGAGEAARREARKAAELEPKNADAYSMLGWILSHDTHGRRFGFDHDRTGARAALEKAVQLNPTHLGARVDLATLLEHNPIGRRFDVGADLRGASEAWKAAYGLDGDAETGNSRTRTLLWGGEFGVAEKWARTLPQSEVRNILLVAAIAAGPGGPSAAIREASTLARGTTRTSLLDGAAGILMLLRQYDAFRTLKSEAGTLTGPQAQMMKAIVRRDPGSKTPVEDFPVTLVQAVLDPSRPQIPYVDKLTRDEQNQVSQSGLTAFRKQPLMTVGVLGDVLRAMSTVKVEGDEKAWRLELVLPAMNGALYLVGVRSAPSVLASDDAPQGVGRYALRLLAKGDEATALRLLDWLARTLRGSVRALRGTSPRSGARTSRGRSRRRSSRPRSPPSTPMPTASSRSCRAAARQRAKVSLPATRSSRLRIETRNGGAISKPTRARGQLARRRARRRSSARAIASPTSASSTRRCSSSTMDWRQTRMTSCSP